jgi:hypothetical protein
MVLFLKWAVHSNDFPHPVDKLASSGKEFRILTKFGILAARHPINRQYPFAGAARQLRDLFRVLVAL